jgi:N-acetylglucosamine-6-sulfatase
VDVVEHHRPITNPTDPDLPGEFSGNPPSYEAIRTATSVYVEYVDREREYHDITTDPDEITNTATKLAAAQRARLHTTLVNMENCHDSATCWSAQSVLR